jgi:hypothetical protein
VLYQALMPLFFSTNIGVRQQHEDFIERKQRAVPGFMVVPLQARRENELSG